VRAEGLGPDASATIPAPDDAVRATVRALGKRYGRHVALDGVNFELAAGEVVGVVGPNAAGKSTLLACLAGTARHEGSATAHGRVAFLPQRAQLPGPATVAEVLSLFSALRPQGADVAELPADFLPAADRRVSQLSGGQRQRVALAAVLGGAPDLILLDEPTANLDPPSRETFFTAVEAHRANGAAVLIASPVAVDVLTGVDRVLVLEAGRLVEDRAAPEYLASLEMTIWVRLVPGRSAETLGALPGVRRTAERGQWIEVDTIEASSLPLLEALRAAGIGADEIRIGMQSGARSPGRKS